MYMYYFYYIFYINIVRLMRLLLFTLDLFRTRNKSCHICVNVSTIRVLLYLAKSLQLIWTPDNSRYKFTYWCKRRKGHNNGKTHYSDVIKSTIASQITNRTIVYSTVYSDADQRKHQSSASLVFVRGIHRWPVNSRTKCQKRGKCFHFMTSSCYLQNIAVPHACILVLCYTHGYFLEIICIRIFIRELNGIPSYQL